MDLFGDPPIFKSQFLKQDLITIDAVSTTYDQEPDDRICLDGLALHDAHSDNRGLR